MHTRKERSGSFGLELIFHGGHISESVRLWTQNNQVQIQDEPPLLTVQIIVLPQWAVERTNRYVKAFNRAHEELAILIGLLRKPPSKFGQSVRAGERHRPELSRSLAEVITLNNRTVITLTKFT